MTLSRSTLAVLVAGTAAVLAASGAAVPAHAGSDAAPRWPAWLCRPGQAGNPCSVVLTTTAIAANGAAQTENVRAAPAPKVDCFYVYPSVSEQVRGNSTLVPTSNEQHVAITQAAQFSQVCRVYAPMYRQVTDYGHGNPFRGSYALEARDVLAAWRDYLAHDNHGRGVVLIGHSEGSFLLEQLIRSQIETSPAERKLLVSAILLGGDVTVAVGRVTGGTFKRTPACRSSTETACVVAYSSWDHTPPRNAELQDVGKGSEHVLCVNPGAPGSSGAAPITPVFPGAGPEGIVPVTSAYAHHPWVSLPHLYTARCVRQGTRAWLLVTRIRNAGDRRPTVAGILAPNWGLHAADVNIALGTLVSLARSESRSWLAHR